MTESLIPVQGTGKNLETLELTNVNGDVVHREAVFLPCIKSSVNSSTDLLSASETFTGEWERTLYDGVTVTAKSDVEGTLYFEYSEDGVSTSSIFPPNGYKLESGIHLYRNSKLNGRYFRIRVVNGDSDQTSFFVATSYGQFSIGNSPINQNIPLDGDALSVRPTNHQDEVRIGRRPGVTGWTKFGYRQGLTASAGEQMIWPDTSNSFVPLTSAETVTITYNSSTDGEGTTGALSLYINYLDPDGLPAVATHTLGNTGSDVTSFTSLGVNRAVVLSSGSANLNTNDITLTATTAGTTEAIVPAGASVTEQCVYHVGSNHDAVAKFLWYNIGKGSGGGNPKVSVKCYVYSRTTNTQYTVFRALINTATEQTSMIEEPIGFNLSPNDVIWFVADTDTNGAEINLRFSLNEYQRI